MRISDWSSDVCSSDLTVGAVAALISVGIGITFGALGGYFGGLVDTALMKVTEFFQVLPTLLFAMVLVTLFGSSLETITIAIGVAIGRASWRERVCQYV